MEMWDKLANKKKKYDPRKDPALEINTEYYMSIKTQEGRDRYLEDLMRRRQAAYDLDRD